jgi:beta-glucanase (GH16 family)
MVRRILPLVLLVMALLPATAQAAPARGFVDSFDTLDATRWSVGAHALGRSQLRPENVGVAGGALALAIPATSTDGGEIRSNATFASGVARARLRAAAAPSSLTGFFLYAPPDYASEIDIELVGDEVLLSTYANGRQTHTITLPLGFDPAAGFHDYEIRWGSGKVTFSIDGTPVHAWGTGVPRAPMNLYANVWFPAWLAGLAPASAEATLIDAIEYLPR